MLEDPFAYEDEPERAQHRQFVAWIAVLLGLVIASAVVVAHADESFKSEGANGSPIELKLREGPCVNELVQKHLRERVAAVYLERFKAATLTWEGKDWASCWIEMGGAVFSIDEEGAPLQPIPRSAFKDDSV